MGKRVNSIKRGTINLNTLNIQSIIQEGAVKPFATFILLKTLYKNGVIFNYSAQNLANKSGLSAGTIRKYVKVFIACGWCKWEKTKRGKNLVFLSLRQFDHNKRKVMVNYKVGKTTKEIISDLYYLIFKQKNNQFNRYVELNRQLKNPSGPKELKYARRVLKKEGLSPHKLPESGEFKMSIKSIGKFFCCSTTTASNIISRLRQNGSIGVLYERTITHRKVWDYNTALDILAQQPNSFFYKGQIVKNECNSYIFNK